METIEVKGAKEFINSISLDNSIFESHFHSYVFRGPSNYEWEIIPSAFRDAPRLFNEYGLLREVGKRTNRDQVEAEFLTLMEFCDELNRNGFHIPSEELLNLGSYGSGFLDFLSMIGRGEAVWPPKEFHSVIALAQHYGIPTRFVDWTYDPLVAAYFAAKGVLKNSDSDYLAVYAIDIKRCGVRSYNFDPLENKEELYNSYTKNKLYQLVRSPSFFNSNLKAQKGVFLAYVEKSFYSNDDFEPFSVDRFLERNKRGKNYKFIIRSQAAEELLHLLRKRFYSASTLFPSIEGCVEAIYEKDRE